MAFGFLIHVFFLLLFASYFDILFIHVLLCCLLRSKVVNFCFIRFFFFFFFFFLFFFLFFLHSVSAFFSFCIFFSRAMLDGSMFRCFQNLPIFHQLRICGLKLVVDFQLYSKISQRMVFGG